MKELRESGWTLPGSLHICSQGRRLRQPAKSQNPWKATERPAASGTGSAQARENKKRNVRQAFQLSSVSLPRRRSLAEELLQFLGYHAALRVISFAVAAMLEAAHRKSIFMASPPV